MKYCDDLDQAERFVRLVFPDLEGQPLDRTKQGNEYFTFMTKDEVIRIARNEGVGTNMQREVALHAAVCAKDFSASIPQIIQFEPENNAMRIQKLPGKPLSDLMDSLPAEELKDVARQTGLFLAELHGFFPKEDDPANAEMNSNKNVLLSRVEKMQTRTTDSDEIARLQRVRDYVAEYETLDDRQAMVHGDISPSNIIYDPATKTIGVIDFNNCHSSLCHRDFSVMGHLFPPSFVEDALESYTAKTQKPMSLDVVKAGADALSLLHGFKDEGMTFKSRLGP